MNNSENIFINSGIRDKATANTLQSKNVKALGYAIGYLLAEEFEYSCPILIATDTRTSGNKIKNDIIEGLLKFDHDIFDAGICPTPFVAKALKDYQPEDEDAVAEEAQDDESFFTLGIVITASHNPAEYNGIKILTPFGYLDTETEQEISNIFHQFLKNPQLIQESLPDESGSVIDFDLASWYQSEILQDFEKTTTKISIVLDCAHGATALIASKIFSALGYQVTAINNSRDGSKINQNSGCSNPEELIKIVQKQNADWGLAFDGDGDRVLIVNKDGSIFDGDDIVSVVAQHKKYKNSTIIVGTIMTNTAIANYLSQQHKKLIRVQVGERNLIQELIKHQAFLGAETCGHIIMMDHAFCSDGIFASLMFLQTIQNQPELIQKKYVKYFQKHTTIPLTQLSIASSEIKNIVKKFEQKYTSRFVIRISNTEPILRVMIEDENERTAEAVLLQLTQELKIKREDMDPRLREDEEKKKENEQKR